MEWWFVVTVGIVLISYQTSNLVEHSRMTREISRLHSEILNIKMKQTIQNMKGKNQ